ncbi:MAG: 50S ribosomal protein L24 [Candidatus Margulisbacteria bacterium]|jgi:large subunit ribosomal protein L24|nr:50S ribosomal protein L24 [Candidatus Margulisiibacteriota bacterium]
MAIKKGDTVVVLAGKNKGKKGKVIRVFPERGKVTVEGVNIAKRHQRPSRNFQGGIIEKPMPLQVSNVMLVCPRCSEPTRIAYKATSEKKARVCQSCNEIMDKV